MLEGSVVGMVVVVLVTVVGVVDELKLVEVCVVPLVLGTVVEVDPVVVAVVVSVVLLVVVDPVVDGTVSGGLTGE